MKLITRMTYAFIEISVDETKTTVFNSDQQGIKELIHNLNVVIDDLSKYLDDERNENPNLINS